MTSPHRIHRPKKPITNYTLATADQILANRPATTAAASQSAFDQALADGSDLARISAEVWAALFGFGESDQHPDYRCTASALVQVRPGIAYTVGAAVEAAGDFGVPGVLTAKAEGLGDYAMIRFVTEFPDGGGISADTKWMFPDAMVLEGTAGACAVWEMLFRVRYRLWNAAKDQGRLR